MPLRRRRDPAAVRERAVPRERVPDRPYRLARAAVTGGWLDLSRDGDIARLQRAGLPPFHTPEQLATWLGLPLARLAWLVHRFDAEQKPATVAAAHYHYHWITKRSGGLRLIESPKPLLKGVQTKLLREILDHVPVHPAAHGFTAGRSITSNAAPHVGQHVVLKFDLENFYPRVRLARVVALFRSLGYSREAAIWLGRLTTSVVPDALVRPKGHNNAIVPYLSRHLPQGAPTSPALANLAAFGLDVRLAGLARKFGARYTRYADDLTFSGDEVFARSLDVFIPLVQKVIRSEQFAANRRKRRVLRPHQRQVVTGVVVNTRVNVSRQAYDRLKAQLTNCLRRGPSTQNHKQHANYRAYLRGSIAHVTSLNAERGARLMALYQRIDWNR